MGSILIGSFALLTLSLIVSIGFRDTNEKFSDENSKKYAFYLGKFVYGITNFTKNQGGWWLADYLGQKFYSKKFNWEQLQIELYTPLPFLGKIRRWALKKMLTCIQCECSIIYYYDSGIAKMEVLKWISKKEVEEAKKLYYLNEWRETTKRLDKILA